MDVKKEIEIIRGSKNTASESKNKDYKIVILNILLIIFKIAWWLFVGFMILMSFIFQIMIWTPLYMFFGVKRPKYKRRKWRI